MFSKEKRKSIISTVLGPFAFVVWFAIAAVYFVSYLIYGILLAVVYLLLLLVEIIYLIGSNFWRSIVILFDPYRYLENSMYLESDDYDIENWHWDV